SGSTPGKPLDRSCTRDTVPKTSGEGSYRKTADLSDERTAALYCDDRSSPRWCESSKSPSLQRDRTAANLSRSCSSRAADNKRRANPRWSTTSPWAEHPWGTPRKSAASASRSPHFPAAGGQKPGAAWGRAIPRKSPDKRSQHSRFGRPAVRSNSHDGGGFLFPRRET